MPVPLPSPISQSGGGYVFHQKTVADGDAVPAFVLASVAIVATAFSATILGIWSCVGITPPWWKTPMRRPNKTLKMTHDERKMRDLGVPTQVRRRGIAGMRNRGSWCGKIERKKVADNAEMARQFFIHLGMVDRRKALRINRIQTGPRSWGRLTRKCW